MNNGFLDELEEDNNEYYDHLDEITEELAQEEQANIVLSEAVKRIEQAKLYETLLKHNLFGPNSARAEIISIVESEIKQFILSRLEILLGIKQNVQQKEYQVFSPEEIDALKAIASKLITKDRGNTQPTLNQVSHQVTINKPSSNYSPAPTINQPTINAIGTVNTGNQRSQQPKKQRQSRRSQNVSTITNADYSQAVNPNKPPTPMPSQAQIDQLNAQQAHLNSGSGGSAIGLGGQSSPISKLIGMAAQQMMHVNRDVKEE
jgi:hypothetical protein